MPARTPKLTVTWFGHSAFRIESPHSPTVLIDPWLDNPKAPPGAATSVTANVILVTHGHGDHIGNTVDIARRTGARVVAIHELSHYLKSHGVATAMGMNKGGTVSIDGLRVTMVDAKHSGDIDVGATLVPGGEAAGFVVKFANGFTIYHAGDTAVFGDMKLIAQMYRPDLAFLPIGGLYTMDPHGAALACKMLKVRQMIGMHYGTFPALTGTPDEVRKHLPPSLRSRVIELEPGTPRALP